MVVILAAQDINMQRAPRRYGKRVKDMWYHFCGQIADFFSLETKIGEAVGTGTDINHSSR